jgi:5-methyltetrahydropteroyltriglutamate--homocysteine methyltransferase
MHYRRPMLTTEPIGSLPRPPALQAAMAAHAAGTLPADALEAAFEDAVIDTLRRLEEAGEQMVTDGEQRKPSFATYPIAGLTTLASDGVTIPFADGHTRQLPVLTGRFQYQTYAASYLEAARRHTQRPLKQAVISASALSLLYPGAGVPGYDRDAFLADLLDGAEQDLRRCLDAGAHAVQIDFTEARLSLKLDPSGGLLDQFVALNNQVLARFTPPERARLGVHTCPGGDHDSTHSADIDYAGLLPALFRLDVGNFYVQLASERDRPRVLALLGTLARADRRVFVGVTDPIDPRVESVDEVAARVLEAARFIDPAHLGTTDDCGFSPFGDDTSTSRDTAFAKIRARVEGTARASQTLGL